MFETEIKYSVLKAVLGVLSHLQDEVKLFLTEDGVGSNVVDPGHSAMAKVRLSKDAFEAYKAKDTTIAVDTAKIGQILKIAKAGDIVQLKHDEKGNKLVVKVGNVTRRIALLDPEEIGDPKIPDLNLPVTVEVQMEDLAKGITASEAITDCMQIIVTPDAFKVESKGDTDTVTMELPKDLLKQLECEEAIKSMFGLNFVKGMVSTIQSDSLVISFGLDHPMRAEADMIEGNCKVTYFIAPRIAEE